MQSLFSDLCDGPVGTPAANEQEASEAIQALVVRVWDELLLWCLVVKPRLPLLLVATYLEETKAQQWATRAVEPGKQPALDAFIRKCKRLACTHQSKTQADHNKLFSFI